jgi:hypothetical protein
MTSNSPRNSRKSFEIIDFRGLSVTAEAASAVSMTLPSGFRGFNVSGPLMKKTESVKSRDTVPLKPSRQSYSQIRTVLYRALECVNLMVYRCRLWCVVSAL